MKYPMYAIRDLKSEFYSPRIEQNEGSARRNFGMTVNTPESVINYCPSDFELYYVGEYDAEKGVLIPIDIPQFVCRGDEMVGVKNA